MHKASHVMYSIANFFQWVVVLASITIIVLSSLAMANIVPDLKEAGFGTSYLVWYILVLIDSLILIALARKAKAKGTSKAWDVLFIVLGVLGMNVFYILGGIFGVCERR